MSDKGIELLAPAGDWEAMEAALRAGADAVYFGLGTLNARRRAKNFTQEEFARAVAAIHERGARAYLTLNIDLNERELGQAARILELARQSGADAVLVRDPALLAIDVPSGRCELGRQLYCRPADSTLRGGSATATPTVDVRQVGNLPHVGNPRPVPFHFSTQTCVTNSADVAAAAELGATRVVLAREMSLEEVAAASAVPGIQTEVFAQGALCFCVSGRCLLSSWVGGHSGNRGACTSPCRVPWTIEGRPVGTPLSMRDLAAIDRLAALRRAGVTAIKIEGRLKNAAWVERAVGLYRAALDGHEPLGRQLHDELGRQLHCRPGDLLLGGGSTTATPTALADLGAYTGRAMTCGYLDGDRDELTGTSGRTPAAANAANEAGVERVSNSPTEDIGRLEELPNGGADAGRLEKSPHEEGFYDLRILVTDKAIECRCQCGAAVSEWTMPKTIVRREHKAVSVGSVLERLEAGPLDGYALGEGTTNDPEFLLVPRTANALFDRISAAIRQARKTPDDLIRIDLPPAVRKVLEKDEPSPANRLHLGDEPDRVRLDAAEVGAFLRQVHPDGLIVENLAAGKVEKFLAAARHVPVVVALPAVFFEDDIRPLRNLLAACSRAKLPVEVNSWGGWHLAKQAGVRIEGGPGMAVLNSLAARVLAQRGLRSVTISVEADRRQIEDIAANCPVPCSLAVFGRPALLTTRVALSAEEFAGKVLEDRRGVQLVPRREQDLWVFRPVAPFDLRNTTNDRIAVAHLVVDLVGSPDPVGDWYDVPHPKSRPFRFNYDRSLA